MWNILDVVKSNFNTLEERAEFRGNGSLAKGLPMRERKKTAREGKFRFKPAGYEVNGTHAEHKNKLLCNS